MYINKSWFKFHRDELPDWQCPTCGNASLNLVPEEFHVQDSSGTKKSREPDEFDADWVQYRFSATLRCSNNRCNEFVSMVGSGGVETRHIKDDEGRWDTSYRDHFTPSFFEPYLTPISIPDDVPNDVRNSLNRSFKLIFANRDAAANQLRVALEVLLDERGVKKTDKNGDALKLGIRVDSHLGGETVKSYELIRCKERLSAIQWIGNDGSHGNESISTSDLLAGFEIIESILATIYPSDSPDLDELAKKMVNKKRPQKAGGKK